MAFAGSLGPDCADALSTRNIAARKAIRAAQRMAFPEIRRQMSKIGGEQSLIDYLCALIKAAPPPDHPTSVLRRLSSGTGVSGTGVSGGLPDVQASRLSTTNWPMALRVCTEAEPTWGNSVT